VRPLSRLVALVRADVPLGSLDPLRKAGGDAYELIDEAPAGTWEKLAAWTAWLLQTYGDNLIETTESTRYVPADTAVMVRQLYTLGLEWIERTRQLAASPTIRLDFHMPTPLPRWPLRTLRSRDELLAMRRTLGDAHARVAGDLHALEGTRDANDHLTTRYVAIESAIETVDLLWIGRGSDELRAAIADALDDGLEQALELGQLLAQPALLSGLGS
jgi:hypothetical protein